jgi:hypothetical protein
MEEPQHGPDSLEGLAFQLILQKLLSLERAMQGIPPLLGKIVAHLEAQTQQPDVPIATYAQLYPELPKDEDDVRPDETQSGTQTGAADNTTMPRRQRLWHWFLRES